MPPHRPPGHPLPPSLTHERIRGLVAGFATVLISGLLLYLSIFGAILFLLLGALYALLLWRGMPLLANFDTTKHYLRGLSGPGIASPSAFPPAQYPPYAQGRPPLPAQQTAFIPVQPAPMRPPQPIPTGPPAGQPAYTEAIAADPATPADVLNAIAGSRPDLHPALARNPATYADLLNWLAQLGDPAVNAELAKRPDRR